MVPVKAASATSDCTVKVMVPTSSTLLGPPVPTPSMSASLAGSLVEQPKRPDQLEPAWQLLSTASSW
eukprot:3334986-Pyramimonas_sp.AAC.1